MRKGWVAGTVSVCVVLVSAPSWAAEPSTERVTDAAILEHRVGRVKVRGSGSLTGDAQRLRGGLEIHQLFQSPLFLTSDARFDNEKHQPYDLRRWGGDVGLGWAFSETTDAIVSYRLDHYKVCHVGSNSDPAFRSVAGRSLTTALDATLRYDGRDDHWYPTQGVKASLGGELALKGLGGDYNFGRVESDAAVYATPFRTHPTGTWFDDVTFVEHFRFGWVDNFPGEDDVPFFERYFVGGTNTVRGQRTWWLTPRGLEEQFVGGEIQLVNNLEARHPIFTHCFHRQLSAAVFFDAGRAFRRFSEIGDFGYAIGAGLRYVVHVWKINGVLRADYGLNLDTEGDNSRGRLHLTFGLAF